MNVQYDLVVDFKRPSKSNTIIVSENDDRSRVCHFILVQDKQPMDMTDVVSADIIGTKPDGTVVFDTSNVEIVRNEAGDYLNELMYTVPGNLTSVSGTVTMRIRILSETSKIESFDFYLVVRNSLYNEDDEIDKETYDGFRELLEQCQKTLEEMKKYAGEATRPNPFPISITVEDDTYTYSGISPVELSITNVAYVGEDLVIETEALEESSVEKCREYAHTCEEAKVVALEGIKAAENAMAAAATSSENADNSEANALVSEGYAVGTQNGEPVVDPDSPYYHNNSKYWSELSKGGGSEVNWNQLETSGTHIADITINGETTEVYAPEGSGGGTDVQWNQIATEGQKIAEITINGEKTDVYASNGGSGASTWSEITEKPFSSIGSGLKVENDVLSAVGGSGSVTEYGTSEQFESEKDNLPIGTEYLITDDCEDVIYTEEEQSIGKWLGKRLYRKVIVRNNLSLPNYSSQSISVDFTQDIGTNVIQIIKAEVVIFDENNGQSASVPCQIAHSEGENSYKVKCLDSWGGSIYRYVYFILEYTKEN